MALFAPLPDNRPGYLGYLGLTAFTLIIISYRVTGAFVAAWIATVMVLVSILSGSLKPSAVRAESVFISSFFFLALLSVPTAFSPGAASVVIVELLKVVSMYLVVVHTLISMNRIMTFTALWFVVYILFPVRGTLITYFLGGNKVDGRAVWNYVYVNPNDLAALTLITAAIGIALFFTMRRSVHRKLALAAVVLAGLVLVLSGSRGVFLGTLVAVIVLLWNRRRSAKALFLVGLLGFAAVAFAPDVVRQRISTIGMDPEAESVRSVDSGSMKERLAIWKTAFEIVEDYPLLGAGIGSFSSANFAYAAQHPESFGRASVSREDAHSTYITVWTELGAVGLLIYLGFFAASWYRVFSARRLAERSGAASVVAQLAALEAGLLGYFTACFFASYDTLTLPYLFLAVCSSWALVMRRQLEGVERNKPSRSRRTKRCTMPVARIAPQIGS